MADSLVENYIHLVFSTKKRLNLIAEKDLDTLYAYIAGILSNQKCKAIKIGGTSNHIHILFKLHPEKSLSKCVQTIKIASSLWLKGHSPEYSFFKWQKGYGAFSVSKSVVERVKGYITNQKQHHQQQMFEEELISFLDKQGADYDPDHVFD